MPRAFIITMLLAMLPRLRYMPMRRYIFATYEGMIAPAAYRYIRCQRCLLSRYFHNMMPLTMPTRLLQLTPRRLTR